MQTYVHEAVRSFWTAWAEWVAETRKSAMMLVCCSAKLLYLSSDITSDIFRVLLILYTILLNKVTQDVWRYTAQILKGLVACIQNKRNLPNLTLYNVSQIIKK